MERASTSLNRSPWPACADCQVEEPSADEVLGAAPSPQGASAKPYDEALFGSIEPSTALGPLRDTVRQQTLAALRRALARAHAAGGDPATLRPSESPDGQRK